MGLFDKLVGRKDKKNENLSVEPMTIYAPVAGTVIPLKEVQDPVFSEGILGPGCAVEPASEQIVAPFHGTVSVVAETKHAIGIVSEDGMEVFVHVGIDTVEMEGKGFTVKVKAGQKVQMGDCLMEFSKATIKNAGFLSTTMVLLTNAQELGNVTVLADGDVKEKDILMRVNR